VPVIKWGGAEHKAYCHHAPVYGIAIIHGCENERQLLRQWGFEYNYQPVNHIGGIRVENIPVLV
jgi:hypothetical protein